jgi:hypothetical protein
VLGIEMPSAELSAKSDQVKLSARPGSFKKQRATDDFHAAKSAT